MPQIKNDFHVQGWKEGGEGNRVMSKRKKEEKKEKCCHEYTSLLVMFGKWF